MNANRSMTAVTPYLPRSGRWLWAVALLGLGLAGCSRPARTGRPAGPDNEAAQLVPRLPERPRPLPAERVLQLVFTSNVAGEVEPCG